MNACEVMRFKALVRQIAAEEAVPAQVVLQNFMLERFLARLEKTQIRENLILKGGLLLSHLLGLARRTTMDMDVTVRNTPLEEANVRRWLTDIFAVDIDDGVQWKQTSVMPIRDDDIYGGFRAKITAAYGSITVPLLIDISTGDVMTPDATQYFLKSLFVQNVTFKLWGYTVETILAEKIETILSRGVLSTRPRDFYDAALLIRVCKPNMELFRQALTATARHRGSEGRLTDASSALQAIAADAGMNRQWEKYRRQYAYAKELAFADVCREIVSVL